MTAKIDWSEKKWRKSIVEPRKYLWSERQIEDTANWANFSENSSVLDVGCGLGFLGWTFASFFSKGNYTGIDISEDLIKDAKKMSSNWGKDIESRFLINDCYKMDFQNDSFDIVMCQTLLMHLTKPQQAVDEMVRVLKKGGTLLCFEPDNATAEIRESYNSVKEFSIEEKILIKKVALYRIAGQKKLGRGDWGIGNKLPYLFSKSGLSAIDMKQNEKINFMVPAYDRPEEQMFLKQLNRKKVKKKDKKYWQKRKREEFFAGGGSQYLYRKYRHFQKSLKNMRKDVKKEIQKKNYFFCSGPNLLFACRGIKKNRKKENFANSNTNNLVCD